MVFLENPLISIRKRTAIFMPNRNKDSFIAENELQDMKKLKLATRNSESVIANTEGVNVLLNPMQIKKCSKMHEIKERHQEKTTSKQDCLTKGENSSINTDVLELNGSRVNKGHDKVGRQEVKRPVALLPERCACKDCQIKDNFYYSNFEKYRVAGPNLFLQKRGIVTKDEQQNQEINCFLKNEQNRDGSYAINQLIMERSYDAGKFEKIRERDERYNSHLCPLRRGNRSTESFYEASDSEARNNKQIADSKLVNGQYQTKSKLLKSKKEEKQDSIAEKIQPTFDKQNLLRYRQPVRQIGLYDEDSAKELNCSVGGDCSEFDDLRRICRCSECSNTFATYDQEYGEWSMKKYPEVNDTKKPILKVKEEKIEIDFHEEICKPWITTSKMEPEKMYRIKCYQESDSEDCESIERNIWSKNIDKRFVDMNRRIKNVLKKEKAMDINDFKDETKIKVEATKLISLEPNKDEDDHSAKLEENSIEEGFLFSRKGHQNTRVKEKKIIMRQLKEKDTGKKSRALANWLERKRVAELNDAFDRLRKMVPTYGNEDRSLSKIKTLRYATTYIGHLALIHEKQCRYGIEDLKNGLIKVQEIDPMLQRCQEHLETHSII